MSTIVQFLKADDRAFTVHATDICVIEKYIDPDDKITHFSATCRDGSHIDIGGGNEIVDAIYKQVLDIIHKPSADEVITINY
jgi:hypothetical protein